MAPAAVQPWWVVMDFFRRQETDRQSREISNVIEKLKSSHDGDQGVIEAVELGRSTIPALRAVMFERTPSGLFHARVRAIEALIALHAYDVLAEYLRFERHLTDPVERMHEEAVINAAARGIAFSGQEWAFELHFDLAKRHLWSGVIGALGSFRRRVTIPILIAALAEDEARIAAESTLKMIGHPAATALIETANSHQPSASSESESDLRRSRRALRLLIEIKISRNMWPRARSLMNDSDLQIAMLACKLCLDVGGNRECESAIKRLHALRSVAGWMDQIQIDQYLAQINCR